MNSDVTEKLIQHSIFSIQYLVFKLVLAQIKVDTRGMARGVEPKVVQARTTVRLVQKNDGDGERMFLNLSQLVLRL